MTPFRYRRGVPKSGHPEFSILTLKHSFPVASSSKVPESASAPYIPSPSVDIDTAPVNKVINKLKIFFMHFLELEGIYLPLDNVSKN